MRIWLLVSLAAAFFVVTAPLLVSAARADDRDLCKDMAALGDRAIAACTREITSGRWRGDDLATLYINRAFSHFAKDDFDRAIADYSEALRLNPEVASVFL